jgi:hypothetical protein
LNSCTTQTNRARRDERLQAARRPSKARGQRTQCHGSDGTARQKPIAGPSLTKNWYTLLELQAAGGREPACLPHAVYPRTEQPELEQTLVRAQSRSKTKTRSYIEIESDTHTVVRAAYSVRGREQRLDDCDECGVGVGTDPDARRHCRRYKTWSGNLKTHAHTTDKVQHANTSRQSEAQSKRRGRSDDLQFQKYS